MPKSIAEIRNVELKLAVLGSDSKTAPYDCPKQGIQP
jgi:hypothetical protein